ncbi:MAG TPA: cupin domain-containing protein [Bacteroidia bacterium]|nr:cupin domain-containing protein [Bacteroidia bacterium]
MAGNYILKDKKDYPTHFGITCIATGEETGGQYFMGESEIPEGDNSTPFHIHTREDESFYITEGELTFEVEGVATVVKTGSFLTVKKGSKHRFYNHSGKKAVMQIIFSPAGIEKMFEEFDRNGVRDEEYSQSINIISEKYGTTFFV